MRIFDQDDRRWAAIAFLIPFVVYLITLAPTITLEDSGEFVAGAATLGILHPPGFPIYAMVGKLFTFIPIGSVAWRVNLFSAFCSSLTAVLMYLIGRCLFRNRPIALSAALLAAFSRAHWSQSVVAEVYALNNFFIMLSFLLLLIWKERRDEKYLYWFSFSCGLGLANHSIMLLMCPPYLVYLFLTDRELWKKSATLGKMFLCLLAGLLPYLYLPIRSAMNPVLDWGNPENLKNFLYHISRSGLREIEFERKVAFVTHVQFSLDFLRQLGQQYTPVLFWLGVIGIFEFFRRFRRELIATGLMFLGPSLGLILTLHFPYDPLHRFIVRVFYIPSHLLFGLWMGAGILFLEGWWRQKAMRGRAVAVAPAAITALILLLPVFPLVANFHENNRHNYYLAYDHGMNILKTAKKNSIVMTTGDNDVFALAYLVQVEKQRPDLIVYDRLGCVFRNPYGVEMLQFTRPGQNRVRQAVETQMIRESGRPVYYTSTIDLEGMDYKQVGLLYRAFPAGTSVEDEPDPVPGYVLRGEDDPSVYKDFWTRNLLLAEYHCNMGVYYRDRRDYARAEDHFRRAAAVATDERYLYFYDLGEVLVREKRPEDALRALEECLRDKSDYESAWLNLGNIHLAQGRLDEAEAAYRKAVEIKPSFAEAIYNIGLVLDKRGDQVGMEKMFKNAMAADPQFSFPYYGLGMFYGDKPGRREEAISYWKKFLELDPRSPYAEAARDNLERLLREGK